MTRFSVSSALPHAQGLYFPATACLALATILFPWVGAGHFIFNPLPALDASHPGWRYLLAFVLSLPTLLLLMVFSAPGKLRKSRSLTNLPVSAFERLSLGEPIQAIYGGIRDVNAGLYMFIFPDNLRQVDVFMASKIIRPFDDLTGCDAKAAGYSSLSALRKAILNEADGGETPVAVTIVTWDPWSEPYEA